MPRLHVRKLTLAFAALGGALIGSGPAEAGEFLVTPWTGTSGLDNKITCTNCALAGFNGALRDIFLKHPSTGTYQVRFKGTLTSPSIKTSVHITALGVPGASCNPYFTTFLGTDYFMNIACQRGGVTPVNTRFMVDVITGTGSWTGAGRAFATIRSNALVAAETFSSSGQQPTFTHPSLGNYTVQFPGLNNNKSGGNAQATSIDFGKHCSLTGWGTNTGGSFASVACYDSNDALTDSNIMVSYEQVYGGGSGGATGFIWADKPTFAGTYTPAATWNRGAGNGVTNTPMTVTRLAKGRYLVDVGTGGFPGSLTSYRAQVTPWGTTATCNVMDIDLYSVNVTCSDRNNALVDAYFSLLYQTSNTFYARNFYQVPVNGTNFEPIFDVGQGLACGTSPTQPGIICVVPSARSTTSDVRQVGGGVPPATVKSVAIANVDAKEATVLVLGTNSVVYATTGNLSQPWDPANNFKTWTTFRQPVDKFNAAVSLKKIISVRATSINGDGVYTVVGLTTAGKTVITHAAAEPWAPYNLTADANVTFKDISHGRDDVYAIKSDNTMIWSSFSGGYGGLPALPNGLLPIAIGGRYVMTNAGKSGATYPCTGPKDSAGYYQCAGAAQRIYRFTANRSWLPMLSSPLVTTREPTTDRDDVLTSGDPLASISPTIVDGEAFEGNFGAAFVYQYFHRLYQLNP